MANDNEFDEKPEGRSKQALILAAIVALSIGAAGAGYWNALNRGVDPDVVAAKAPAATSDAGKAQPSAAKAEAPVVKPLAQPDVAVVEVQKPAETQVVVPAAKPEETQVAVPAVPLETKTEEAPPQQVAVAKPVEPPAAPVAPKVMPKAEEAPKPAVAIPAEVPAEASVSPSFDTVRVSPNGDTVIAGRAKPGAEVLIKHSGQVIGKVAADASGSFAFVTEKPLPAGAGVLSLETQLNGKTLVSDQTVAVAVKGETKGEALVAVVKPDAPAQIVQAPTSSQSQSPSTSVVLDAVDYDAAGNIIFSGRGKPNASVRLYVDNVSAGETKTDTEGRWMFAGSSAVTPGTHMLRADEVGADGKVTSRVELPFLREEVAKVAAAGPAVEPSVEPATGGEPVASVDPARMVIQPGNNLWKLSRQVYGKGIRYTVIWEANKGQIRDPNLIYPGQVFVMPTGQP